MLNSSLAFMFFHELGYHVLGHTKSKEKHIIKTENETYSYEVDSVSIIEEYDADNYAFDEYIKLLIVDEKRYYTFFKYRFEFAPLLFFDICYALDNLSRKVTGKKIIYNKHPNLHKRRNRLRDTKVIELSKFYFDFRNAVYDIYKKWALPAKWWPGSCPNFPNETGLQA